MNFKFYNTGRWVKDLTTRRTIQTEDKSIIRFTTVDRLPENLKERVEINTSTTVPFDIMCVHTDNTISIQNKSGNVSFYQPGILRLLSIEFGINLSRAIFYMKGDNDPLVTYYKGYYYMVMPVEYNKYMVQNMIKMGVISVC